MEFEQKFSEADLIELERVFSKTVETKNSKMKFWRDRRIKICLFVLSGILFLCSAALYFLEGSFSNSIKLYLVIAIKSLCWPFLLEALKKKKDMLPAKMVKNRYGEPFGTIFKESSLIYRDGEFSYNSVSDVIEYKNFLFLYADGKWLIIKADEEEKEFMLTKMGGYSNIQIIRKEEPFNLKEYGKNQWK